MSSNYPDVTRGSIEPSVAQFQASQAKDLWANRGSNMRCLTCMWYVHKPGPVNQVDQLREVGRCRRHAPAMGGFPVVRAGDWCGDHRLAEEKA